MGAPLLRRKSVLAAKVEATVGTAESLTGSEAAFNVFNLKIQPEIGFETRERHGNALSRPTGSPGGRVGVATFDIELTGGASAPSWASTLLPACGMPLTSLVASFESKPPEASGANTKTITIASYIDGKIRKICGAMGTFVMKFTAGQRIILSFTFRGKWVAPNNGAMLTPTFPTAAPLVWQSSVVTIGSYAAKCQTLEIDIGNELVMREDPSDPTAYHSCVIADRAVIGKFDPESTLTGTHGAAIYDPNADLIARTERALSIEVGSTGNKVAIAAPKLQITKDQEAERNKLSTDEVEFQLNQSASAGDDELTLTFS